MPRCRNAYCDEDMRDWSFESHAFGWCPSCWWMAKTSFAVGSMTVAAIAFISGVIAFLYR